MKKMHILLLGALPILLLFVTCAQDTPTLVNPSAVQTDITLAKNSNIDAFDMNDRFGAPPSGAKGNGTVKVINGQMDLTIHARGLETGHDYEVHVAVGAPNGGLVTCETFEPAFVHVFQVTIDKNGKFTFKIVGLNLGLASGEYRIDYVVVDDPGHFHPPAPFPTNLLLACQPASCVTIN